MSATLTFGERNDAPGGLIQRSEAREKNRLDEKYLRAQRLESIGMLASGIAHDLNNILSPIMLAAPALREHATNPEDLRIITSLEKSAERGVELVRQILSFAHGASSVPQLVQIKHILRETLTVARETYPKNISVEYNFPDNLWPIMADPSQMHQVLLNLCVNARDAMPSGGTLSLSAENCLLDEAGAAKIEGGRPGAWVVLRVEDTGSGIPPEAIPHIWEPFFTTKDVGKGTGLGLSTVRSIVENHRGFISLNTQAGLGTTFRVYIPAAEASTKDCRLQPPPVKKVLGSGELILVVDDDTHIREMTAAMLSRNGYQVLTAADGTEAVATFAKRSSEISLVITDLIMPRLDGPALASIVQHLNPKTRVMAMSGLSSAGGTVRAERFGGAFLYKPFKVQTLLSMVHETLHPVPVAEVA
jgi:nitrogen-specific signal transduction histidine kinase/CheY-like chemotaxis protein